jgi:hypothetical protein
MGIRFFCQECNKRLNVKGFLAGKRGVCPHCGAKVDIPWESQSEGGASPAIAPRSVAAATAPVNGSGFGAALGTTTAPASPFPAITPTRVLPMSGPAPVSAPDSAAEPAPADIPGAKPLQPAAQPAAPTATPVAKAVPTALPAAPTVAQAADPIAEAPSAVWYVRPPSGGQYGPASGEIMRKWLTEGRVSADSLIWREGWPDWKAANSQFPQLGGAAAAVAAPSVAPVGPPQPTVLGPSVTPSTPNAPGRTYPRKKNNSLAVVIVVLLTLMSIALFGVLIAVVQFMQ